MKIYKSIFTIVACSIIGLACNKNDINLKPSLPTDATYFQTQDQFNQGVIGIYSKLTAFYNFRGYAGNQWLHGLRLLPDDDLTTNTVDPYEVFNTITPSDGRIHDYFLYLYQLNARANDMLDVFNKNADKVYTDKNLEKYNKGEILFLRGFSHFQLWNMYGVAPVINNRITADSLLYPSNSTGTQLLDAAIADFTAASQLLPVSWDAADLGRITKGAALGFAGKALVFRGTVNNTAADFTTALGLFNQITGYTLVPNYYDNFSLTKTNNAESIFEIQFGANSGAGGSNPWLSPDQFTNGDLSGYWGFFDNHWSVGWGGESYFFATSSLKNAFSANDPRYQFSLDGNGHVVKYVLNSYGGQALANVGYFNNARVLRYADIVLLQAEATLQSGGTTAAAIDLINQVRTRARNITTPASTFPANLDRTVTNKTQILKWIIEERRVELAFEEGHRWYDLRRWHMGGQLKTVYGKDLTSWDFSSVQPSLSFQPKNLYYPIPFTELQLNTKLSQNPLWQ
jgi:hypothetical protein